MDPLDFGLITFAVAIVLTRHKWNTSNCSKYFTAEELVLEMNSLEIYGGDERDFHIHFAQLLQGIFFFKKVLKSKFGIELNEKKAAHRDSCYTPSYRSLSAKSSGYELKFNTMNAHAETETPITCFHGVTLLKQIRDIRDLLLIYQKIKEPSSYQNQSQIANELLGTPQLPSITDIGDATDPTDVVGSKRYISSVSPLDENEQSLAASVFPGKKLWDIVLLMKLHLFPRVMPIWVILQKVGMILMVLRSVESFQVMERHKLNDSKYKFKRPRKIFSI